LGKKYKENLLCACKNKICCSTPKTTQKTTYVAIKKRGNRDSGQEKAVTRIAKSFAYIPT
jgi:hypothetical protein